ncbi:helix-turn-helix domain-containing protein [Bacteroides fragilis]|nr:helix-turn-helix domain-containing protein [Bacteroides fragilis]
MKKKKETPMHPVVENIRKIIMDKGITQVAASELVGTSASQMSKILNGEVQISIWQISNFATNLGMEIIHVQSIASVDTKLLYINHILLTKSTYKECARCESGYMLYFIFSNIEV